MRMGLSALNAHRRKYHFIDNAICPNCHSDREDTAHFFLKCPQYTAARTTMLNSLNIILPETHQTLLDLVNKQKVTQLTKILLTGIQETDIDIEIFKLVANYVQNTGRFI